MMSYAAAHWKVWLIAALLLLALLFGLWLKARYGAEISQLYDNIGKLRVGPPSQDR